MNEKIFVFGASGHAKVVIDIIERLGRYTIAFLVDDNPELKGSVVYGYPVIGGKAELLESGIRKGIVAIGSNAARRMVSSWISSNGFERIVATHPAAHIARGVTIASGTVVMAGAVINSDSVIGHDVIVNTQASIDHDCTIGDGAHIAPGTTLCGTVSVGEGCFVCAGATIIPNVTIGSNVTVAAGATVISNISDNLIVAGTPAKILNKEKARLC